MGLNYHAVWLDAAGNIVVSTNSDTKNVKVVRVPASATSTDNPILITNDGVDEGNERQRSAPGAPA